MRAAVEATPELRRRACCGAEPPCVLCPLLPANAHRSLHELVAEGLRGNLSSAEAAAIASRA